MKGRQAPALLTKTFGQTGKRPAVLLGTIFDTGPTSAQQDANAEGIIAECTFFTKQLYLEFRLP